MTTASTKPVVAVITASTHDSTIRSWSKDVLKQVLTNSGWHHRETTKGGMMKEAAACREKLIAAEKLKAEAAELERSKQLNTERAFPHIRECHRFIAEAFANEYNSGCFEAFKSRVAEVDALKIPSLVENSIGELMAEAARWQMFHNWREFFERMVDNQIHTVGEITQMLQDELDSMMATLMQRQEEHYPLEIIRARANHNTTVRMAKLLKRLIVRYPQAVINCNIETLKSFNKNVF